MSGGSRVEAGPGGTAFVGPDAVALYRAAALEAALRAYHRTGMLVTRGASVGRMIRAAAPFLPPGGRFPSSRAGALAAAEGIKRWKEAMASAIPVAGGG